MAKPLPIQHSLFEPPARPPRPQPRPQTVAQGLWAALQFPRLPLEVLREEVDVAPWVAVHEIRGQQCVLAASHPAETFGVLPGMALTAAYALCPELQTEWRDEAAEQAALIRLADWLMQFSSMVSLAEQALLLEIGGSLSLFGGLEALKGKLLDGLAGQPHQRVVAIAPTPQAALLLARCGAPAVVEEADSLRAVLGRLPVNALPITEKQSALFRRLGVRHLRDVWRLPSDGLARRFGRPFVIYLEQLLGQRAEPRRPHREKPLFSARWSFPLETDRMSFILHGLEKLVPQLEHFMRLRQLAVNHVQLIFYHSQQPTSHITVGMQELCREGDHLLRLLNVKLNQTRLAAPVVDLELIADEFHPWVDDDSRLFADGGDEQDRLWRQTLDQLCTRLGANAVTGLQLLNDHRPERSWDYAAPATLTQPEGELPQRPLWLLAQPQSLGKHLNGVVLMSEPERIEGGWWDGDDVRRDYYRARDRAGRRLWVFYDLNGKGWYLHGVFG